MEGRLQLVLALGRHPAEVNRKHADALALHGIGGGFGEGRQCRLGGRIDDEVWRAAIGQHAANVDHRSAITLTHQLHSFLHHEQRCLYVDGEDAVESVRCRVIEAPALGVAGGVHQHVETAKAFTHQAQGAAGCLRIRHISGEDFAVTEGGKFALLRRQRIGAAVNQHHAGKPVAQQAGGSGCSQPLGATGNEGNTLRRRHAIPFTSTLRSPHHMAARARMLRTAKPATRPVTPPS